MPKLFMSLNLDNQSSQYKVLQISQGKARTKKLLTNLGKTSYAGERLPARILRILTRRAGRWILSPYNRPSVSQMREAGSPHAGLRLPFRGQGECAGRAREQPPTPPCCAGLHRSQEGARGGGSEHPLASPPAQRGRHRPFPTSVKPVSTVAASPCAPPPAWTRRHRWTNVGAASGTAGLPLQPKHALSALLPEFCQGNVVEGQPEGQIVSRGAHAHSSAAVL